ncbi:hypothetical protein [Nitratireductor aquibiodomus]|uniref:hypothetical protein n=1 Tax=Nitratireductor aquibiodomus TaxID=204799 RepID=UPI0012DECD47|nr:hypothetical protein [Nitratireductor aquibiodomus]
MTDLLVALEGLNNDALEGRADADTVNFRAPQSNPLWPIKNSLGGGHDLIAVSDILKILDQIPVWRSLTSLPKRIAELEARVATLESGKAATKAPGRTTARAAMRSWSFKAKKSTQLPVRWATWSTRFAASIADTRPRGGSFRQRDMPESLI